MKRVKGIRYLYRREGTLWFRRSIPERDRVRVGQREWVRTLGTSSIEVARHLISHHLAEYERVVGNRSSARQPAEIASEHLNLPPGNEIDGAVRVWFADRMDRYSARLPSDRDEMEAMIGDLAAVSRDASAAMPAFSKGASASTEWIAAAICETMGWTFDPAAPPVKRLVRTVARGQLEAAKQIRSDLLGEPRRVEDGTFSPEQYALDAERRRDRAANLPPVSLMGLFRTYCAERCPSPATVKAWKPILEALIAHLGHDDAAKIVPTDIVGWKEHLLSTPGKSGKLRSQKTVGEKYLAAIKTVLAWGSANHKLATNPATGVTVRIPRKLVTRERGLNDEEANIILAGAMAAPAKRLSSRRALAQRWVPWICAYTGARVNEITQLRAEDIREIKGIWTITITPEAGSVKTGVMRTVAMHAHLIEQGLPEVVKGRSGPLFYDPEMYKGGRAGNPQYKKCGEYLARWVRDLGVDDKRVQPNHGWRHRFKTQSRTYRMDTDVVRAIQGHAPRDEGEEYGDTFPAVTRRELDLLPRYVLTAG